MNNTLYLELGVHKGSITIAIAMEGATFDMSGSRKQASICLAPTARFISAWGNAPGIAPNHGRALKARFKAPGSSPSDLIFVDHRNESRLQRCWIGDCPYILGRCPRLV